MLRQVGDITYELNQKQIKKMYLRLKPEGRVVVSCPHYVTMKQADQFVLDNLPFIQEGLARYEEKEARKPPPPQFATGDVFYLLGEELQLTVLSAGTVSVVKEGNQLLVSLGIPTEKDKVRKMLSEYFTQEMRDVFFPLMREYQEKFAPMGIPKAQLKVRDMKSQWGSCNRRNDVITLNSRLIHLPYPYIEYVVLHEFCHFIHGNHSKDFYQLVASFMPDWKSRREAMKPWAELF